MINRKCNYCGRPYNAQRPQSKFCSTSCRVRNHQTPHLAPTQTSSRKETAGPGKTSVDSTPIETIETNSLLNATRNELESAGVVDTLLGQQALRIATEMSGFGTAGGMAALSKELSRVMADALRSGMAMTVDPVDELKARREKKLAG